MGKLDRAHSRGMTTAFRNAWNQAEDAGDEEKMEQINDAWKAHESGDSRLDRAILDAGELRDVWRNR